MPLHEATLAEGEPPPSETDVETAVSKNKDFWEYVDAKGVEEPEEGWAWKLRLQFVNNAGTSETHTTATLHGFYRAVAKKPADSPAGEPFDRVLQLVGRVLRSVERSNRRMTKAHAEAAKAMHTHAAAALGKVGEEAAKAIGVAASAAGTALAEASKQTSEVSKLAHALFEETGELKNGIFKLQTERAKGPAEAPKNSVSELKDFVETARTLVSLGDKWFGAAAPEKPQAGAESAGTGDT